MSDRCRRETGRTSQKRGTRRRHRDSMAVKEVGNHRARLLSRRYQTAPDLREHIRRQPVRLNRSDAALDDLLQEKRLPASCHVRQ